MAGTLSQPQFDVLYALLRADAALTQRQIHASTGLSLGSVNAVVRECEALGHIAERRITESGRSALEPYRVDNAVIMADLIRRLHIFHLCLFKIWMSK